MFSAAGGNSLRAPGTLSAPALVDSLGGDYPLLAIVGPTAAGKSVLAIEVAVRLHGEVVNCDSVQVYRGFDIGTGKVPPEERQGIPHYLLDTVEPDQVFTAGDYRQEAMRLLAEVKERRKLPIVVGGTGLYLRALLMGLFEGPQRSQALRARLAALGERRGREFLHRLLARLDPAAAARIHPRDTSKAVRAIEVCLLAHQPMSAMLQQGRAGLEGFRVLKIGLRPERRQLAHRINARVERMFASGLLEEARAMLARPDASRIKPLGALGYRQACAVLRGEMTPQDAMRKTQTATRQYAKRQMTWFRREGDICWFEGFGDEPEIQRRILAWLQQVWPGRTRAVLHSSGSGSPLESRKGNVA
jgi:tRNA dimethylallyltransferase